MAKISVETINRYLSKLAPPKLAEEWDNVGLQVGNLMEPVSGILISLDVTEAVLWEAVEHDANLIVTHHPLFFRSIRCLDDSTVPTRLARLATQMGINILSFHTNLDATTQGLNDQLAKTLQLKTPKPLLPTSEPGFPKAGLGRIGKIKKTTLAAFLKSVARRLQVKDLCYVGDPKHLIEQVAVMTGSGGGFFSSAQSAGADVLVTGDVKYHHALDALQQGIALVDIGHFAGEIGMVKLVAQKLKNFLKTKKSRVKVHETQAQSDPIQFWHG